MIENTMLILRIHMPEIDFWWKIIEIRAEIQLLKIWKTVVLNIEFGTLEISKKILGKAIFSTVGVEASFNNYTEIVPLFALVIASNYFCLLKVINMVGILTSLVCDLETYGYFL